ncbi:MAG: (d)CMP kinase [Planctomycetota bacterium]
MPLTRGPHAPIEIFTEAPVPANTPLIVTIDGPAGTGKSTVARALALRLGLDFLDTGAMYRAAAAVAIDQRLVDALEAGETADLLERIIDADLHFDWRTDPPAILAWDAPLDSRIREPDVTAVVSKVAKVRTIRKHMVQKQRIIGHQHPRLVTEGRDQGSVVFPDAAVKFYLDAKPEVRASRRAAQMRDAGKPVEVAQLLAQIVERDKIDSTREDGPLVCPSGAEIVDTSALSLDEVIVILESITRARVAEHLASRPDEPTDG